MSRRRKILPGGTTLQAKESFPMRERRVRLVQVREARVRLSVWMSSSLRSAEMEAVIVAELSSMPKKVNVVVGPSVFFRLERSVYSCAERSHETHIVVAFLRVWRA